MQGRTQYPSFSVETSVFLLDEASDHDLPWSMWMPVYHGVPFSILGLILGKVSISRRCHPNPTNT